MANQKFQEFRKRIVNSITASVAMAVNDVKQEEARLKAAGWQVAGPFEKFVRAVIAAGAAFRAVWVLH